MIATRNPFSKIWASLSVIVFMALSTPANAGLLLWSLEYKDIATNGANITTLATVTTTDTLVGGWYTILDLDGTRNGATIDLLAPLGFAGNDNRLSPGAPHVDFSGVSFLSGADSFNLYWSGSAYRECSTQPGAGCTGIVTDGPAVSLQLSQVVPEPTSLALLGLAMGLLGLGKLGRRRGADAIA